jgi:hypothetical protein
MPSVSTPAITAQQLQFQYSWSAIPPDDPRVTGHADTTFLNRHEGYEVLPFLNRACTSLAQAQKAERGIRQHLPGNVRSRANVLTWLNANWSSFN